LAEILRRDDAADRATQGFPRFFFHGAAMFGRAHA
jgi:hypothetical protein